MNSLQTVLGLVLDLLQVIAAVVGAVLIGSRVRPPARTSAVLGCLLFAASGLLTAVYRLLVPFLISTLHLPVGAVVAAFDLVFALLTIAGIAMLVRGVLLGARTASAPPAPYSQGQYPQGPYPQAQYPQAPYPPGPGSPQWPRPDDRT